MCDWALSGVLYDTVLDDLKDSQRKVEQRPPESGRSQELESTD